MQVFSLPAPCSCRLGRAAPGGIEICERSANLALQLSQTRYSTLSDRNPAQEEGTGRRGTEGARGLMALVAAG